MFSATLATVQGQTITNQFVEGRGPGCKADENWNHNTNEESNAWDLG
jgi:hypothetical protein